jgi:hypothetical protein
MKPIFSIREMFLIIAIAVLSLGWLMDRYRQEKILKIEERVQKQQSAQLSEATDIIKYTNEMYGDLRKKVSVLELREAARREAADSKEIPLSEVYSTSEQPGLKLMNRGQRGSGTQQEYVEKYGYQLEQIYTESSGVGASNTFLVEAPDIAGAVAAAASVFLGSRSAETPATGDYPGSPRGHYWK